MVWNTRENRNMLCWVFPAICISIEDCTDCPWLFPKVIPLMIDPFALRSPRICEREFFFTKTPSSSEDFFFFDGEVGSIFFEKFWIEFFDKNGICFLGNLFWGSWGYSMWKSVLLPKKHSKKWVKKNNFLLSPKSF